MDNLFKFHQVRRNSVATKGFHTDPNLFQQDVGQFVNEVIEKYALQDRKACILRSKFQRDLGIYWTIGAKMARRAREVLGWDERCLIS